MRRVCALYLLTFFHGPSLTVMHAPEHSFQPSFHMWLICQSVNSFVLQTSGCYADMLQFFIHQLTHGRAAVACIRTCSSWPWYHREEAQLGLLQHALRAAIQALESPTPITLCWKVITAWCWRDREKAQLGLLLHALRAAVPAPFARLPAAPALLFAEASVALAAPTAAMFGPLNKLLLRGSPPDLTVPCAAPSE